MVDPETGQMSPRKCDLRAFVVTGKNTHAWYSGLTRYSSIPGQMIVNSSQGGGFKDTWVLAKETGVEHDYAPGSEVVRVLEQSRKHSLALVTASKADNLFWLGRYTERVFTTLSQFFPFYDRVMDTDVDAFRPFARALDLPEDFEDFDAFIHSFLYDEKNPDSVRSAIVYAFNNAVILRPELGSRSLQQVELAMSSIVEASEYGGTDADIFKHRDIADNMLAFWGGVENSPRRTDSEIVHFRGQISGTSGSVHTIRIFRGRAQGAARQTGQLHPAVERSAGTAMLRRRIALAGRPAAAAGICGACGKTGDAAERFRWAHLHEGSEGSGHAQHDGHGRRATVKNTCHSHRTVRV